jgi:pimeloyl-ACP methyl ester carboxylesterase
MDDQAYVGTPAARSLVDGGISPVEDAMSGADGMTSADPESVHRVLLPGMNCSARLWPGLGPAITPRLTESTLERQVARLLDELPGRVELVGLSLGAVVAMAVARFAPERVASLCLLSTNPRRPTEAQLASWRSQRDRLADGATARDLQRDLLPLLLTVESIERRPDLVETTLAMADDVGETELDAQLALQATRIDERPGLRTLRCPTFVVAASYDRLCPIARHTEIASLVPGARLRVLERAGHLSPLERPLALRRLLTIEPPAR